MDTNKHCSMAWLPMMLVVVSGCALNSTGCTSEKVIASAFTDTTSTDDVEPTNCQPSAPGESFEIQTNADLALISDYDTIDGDLTLTSAALTELTELDCLKKINGNLTITETGLEHLGGLRGLTTVLGNVEIIQNPGLKSLDGLDALTSIGGILFIYLNPALEDLEGLSELAEITGELYLYDNNGLEDLSGLASLDHVGGISICGNENMETLEGLDSLSVVDGRLRIGCADNIATDPSNGITDMRGLENITHVKGYMVIFINDYMETVSGLEGLEKIDDILYIGVNNQLKNLDGLSNLISVGGDLQLKQNAILTSLSGLCALEALMGDIWFILNDSLDECEAFALVAHLILTSNWNNYYHAAPEDYMLPENLSDCELWTCEE
ncbi:MAG: hypothetical protein QNJ97_07720 [Myxococcota bacterium]|nr:hypothetical protein [Myxococcota bacterium]